MKGYRRILRCCSLIFTFLDSYLLFITAPHFYHLPLPQDWSHTWSPRKISFHDWKTWKNLPLPLGTYSSELSLPLLKIHGLFLVSIHLALAFTYILHFDLPNKLPFESSIQQFLFHNFPALDSMFLFLTALQIFQYLL